MTRCGPVILHVHVFQALIIIISHRTTAL